MGCQNYVLTLPSNHQAPLVGLTVSRPNPSRATLLQPPSLLPHYGCYALPALISVPWGEPPLSSMTALCLLTSSSPSISVWRGVPSYRKLTLYLCSGRPRPSRPHPINLPTSPRFPNVFNLFLFSLLPSKHAQLSHPSQANTKPTFTPYSLVTYPALSPTSKLNFLKPFALPVSTSALCVHHFMKLISSLSEKH